LSNVSSAQLDLHALDEAAAETEAVAPFGLKEQVAERLAAHRARRNQRPAGPVTPIAPPTPAKASAARIAAAVAERYAHSQSYRAFLAAEAEAAIRQAEAAAQVAALTAQAVADAQYQLLAELDQWALTPPPVVEAAPVLLPCSAAASEASQLTESFAADKTFLATPSYISGTQNLGVQTVGVQTSDAGLTVRLYEDVPRSQLGATATTSNRRLTQPFDEAEGLALDDEIAFRQSPVFEELLGSPIEIPANLIEFPRQLVAARRARPRLAEGPLREDDGQLPQSPDAAQLRIFEVEATQISTTSIVEALEPEWSSILLGALPPSAPVDCTEPLFNPILPPQAAPLNLRLMAGIVDACLIVASVLAFSAVFAITVDYLAGGHPGGQFARSIAGQISGPASGPMSLQAASISAAVVLGVLTLLYHLLFFTLADATPGMLYARIGLCTFSDENPTRSAMRRRLFAMVLSACPIGIGFLWACLDDDRLGWHDRISRMYQRSY
jgi:uncharacterized RDD family membrane protein YckC